jgi:polysaccharide pyruvyl transferase WcaK-like protein
MGRHAWFWDLLQQRSQSARWGTRERRGHHDSVLLLQPANKQEHRYSRISLALSNLRGWNSDDDARKAGAR